MSMRAVFSGHLRLGLLSIPVKAYSAYNSAETISFNLLHSKCGNRINTEKVCRACGDRDLKDADLVKGYQYSKGQYVQFTASEINALKVASDQSINLTNFVDADSIDPLALDGAYYIGPDEKQGFSKQALATLRAAMGNRVAIGKVTMDGRQRLVAIRVKGNGFVMQTMLRPEEVRPIESVGVVAETVNDTEVAMATQLVDSFTQPYDFAGFKDDYHEGLKQIIDARLNGKPFVAPAAAPTPQASSLFEALKASLAKPELVIPSVPELGKKKPAKMKATAKMTKIRTKIPA